MTYFSAKIIHLPDPTCTFVPSLGKIGDLSCTTSSLVLFGFIFHYQFSHAFKSNTESVEEEAVQIYVRQMVVDMLKVKDCVSKQVSIAMSLLAIIIHENNF